MPSGEWRIEPLQQSHSCPRLAAVASSDLVDAFGELLPRRSEVSLLWQAWKQAEQALEEHSERMERAEEERHQASDKQPDNDAVV